MLLLSSKLVLIFKQVANISGGLLSVLMRVIKFCIKRPYIANRYFSSGRGCDGSSRSGRSGLVAGLGFRINT